MAIVKISGRGQVLIPTEMRERIGLHPGDQVSVQDKDGVVFITPVAQDPISSLRGALRGQPSLIDELMRLRQKERARNSTDVP